MGLLFGIYALFLRSFPSEKELLKTSVLRQPLCFAGEPKGELVGQVEGRQSAIYLGRGPILASLPGKRRAISGRKLSTGRLPG